LLGSLHDSHPKQPARVAGSAPARDIHGGPASLMADCG
jgi:hypothetical protein